MKTLADQTIWPVSHLSRPSAGQGYGADAAKALSSLLSSLLQPRHLGTTQLLACPDGRRDNRPGNLGTRARQMGEPFRWTPLVQNPPCLSACLVRT
ncbi:unnamed protein product, partial [Protopolystoma xenopodis]